jgi:hypothetical protein
LGGWDGGRSGVDGGQPGQWVHKTLAQTISEYSGAIIKPSYWKDRGPRPGKVKKVHKTPSQQKRKKLSVVAYACHLSNGRKLKIGGWQQAGLSKKKTISPK